MRDDGSVSVYRRFLLPLLLCVFLVHMSVPAVAETKADKAYQSMLRRLKAGDSGIDFAKLRMLWTRTSSYRPYAGALKERSLRTAFARGKYRKVLQMAKQIRRQNYLDILSHIMSADAHQRLGNKKAQKYHYFVARGLILSIGRSGDGKSPATAFKIVAFTEEARVLSMMNLKKTGQRLVRAGGRAYDRLTVRSTRGDGVGVVYFDVTPLLARQR